MREDLNIRRNVAATMGIGEAAIWMDINAKIGRNGVSVAKNYDGLNKLHDLTGIMINDLREIAPEKQPRKKYTKKESPKVVITANHNNWKP